jgi:hypothetical protein
MSRALLTLFALVLGVEAGAGLFEAVVVVPLWSESLDAARHWAASAPLVPEGGRFFGVASPLLSLITIAVLLTSRRLEPAARRPALAAAAIVFVLIVATFAYYLPGQSAMKAPSETFTDSNFSSQAQLWVRLNWVRQLVGLVAFWLSLRALPALSIGNSLRSG